MNRSIAAALTVLMLGATLTACGGDDDKDSSGSGGSDYCDQLKDAKDEVAGFDLSVMTPETYDQLTSDLEDIRDNAPDDLKDDWGVLTGLFDDMSSSLEKAGLSIDDLLAMQNDPSQVPADIDMEALQQAISEITALSSSAELETALDNIREDTKDECGFDLVTDPDATNSGS